MPDSLLVNLAENEAAIRDLLTQLPRQFAESFDIGCALGPALQVAHKLMAPTGGRVSVMLSSLPNRGPGSLAPRESSGDSDKDAEKLRPQTDFYKRLALDCSTQQIAVDLFLLNSQYADLATVGMKLNLTPLFFCVLIILFSFPQREFLNFLADVFIIFPSIVMKMSRPVNGSRRF